MFGSNNTLKKIILKNTENYVVYYLEAIKDLANNSNSALSENDLESIKNDYLNAISNSSFDVFKASPRISQRISDALKTPSIAGCDFALGTPLTAGEAYSVLFWAYSNKIAKPSDCLELNQKQKAIVDSALATIADIL